MKLKTGILIIFGIFALPNSFSYAYADDYGFWDHLGGTAGASYSLGEMGNTAMGLPSRLLSSWDIEVLPGYQINNHWLVGIDFDYRFAGQITSLASAGGTNLGGNAWNLGLGAKYTFNAQWSLQGSIDFVGAYTFSKQTYASDDDHLGSPLSIHLKPQFHPINDLPFSIDLDLRYTDWTHFTIASTSSSSATSDWTVGVGITYHFVKPEKQKAKQEPKPEQKPVEALPQPTPQIVAETPPVPTMESTQSKLAELLDVKKTDHGLMLNMKSDSFPPNSTELSGDAKDNIAKVGKIIAQNPSQKVRVEGYTDSSGPKKKNIQISQKRAESVKAVLVDNGVKTENISTQGFGPDKPIADNKTLDGRNMNRRVEIYIDEGNK